MMLLVDSELVQRGLVHKGVLSSSGGGGMYGLNAIGPRQGHHPKHDQMPAMGPHCIDAHALWKAPPLAWRQPREPNLAEAKLVLDLLSPLN